MKLLIVIVNYRTADLTIDCLRSLAGEAVRIHAEVVIVENGSTDDSAAKLEHIIRDENWGDWARVMDLKENRGFSCGNNAAIAPALEAQTPPDYLLLLNPDTIVQEGAIEELLRFMNANPGVGIAGSRLENPDGSPQISAFRFHSIGSELESGIRLGIVSKMLKDMIVAGPIPERAVPTDWVAGASMIVRRQVFEEIGLLDEGYFMYFEEVDFCLRARHAGWPCWYVPASRVIHLVGKSSGVTDANKPKQRRPAYWFESRKRYFRKHFSEFRAYCADLAWAGGHVIYQLRRRIQGLPDNDPTSLLTDFIAHTLDCHHARTDQK